MFKNASHAPSFKVIVSCYKPDAEQLFRVKEFSFRTEQQLYRFFFLQTLPSTTVINYALFYQFCVKKKYILDQEYSVRLLSTTS